MKTRVFGMISLVLLASASVASAQSFTYSSKASPPTMSVGGAGMPYAASALSQTREIMMGGKKITAAANCVSMSQSPNNKVFESHVMCRLTEAEGTYDLVSGCSNSPKGVLACWGRMIGQTGVYANRTGVISSTGKDGVRTGSGHWEQ